MVLLSSGDFVLFAWYGRFAYLWLGFSRCGFGSAFLMLVGSWCADLRIVVGVVFKVAYETRLLCACGFS